MAEEGLGVSPTADLNEKALIMPAGTFFRLPCFKIFDN